VRLFYIVLLTPEWYRPRQLFGRTSAIHPEMVGGASPIPGKVIIFTLGLYPSQDENAGGLETNKKSAKFLNHSQGQIRCEIGHDSVKCSM